MKRVTAVQGFSKVLGSRDLIACERKSKSGMLEIKVVGANGIEKLGNVKDGFGLGFSCEECSKKDKLVARILTSAPQEQIDFLQQAGQMKKQEAEGKRLEGTRKHKCADDCLAHRVAQRLDDMEEETPAKDAYDSARFLELPSTEEVKDCYRKFYDATSNAALASGVCGVCVREAGAMDWFLQLLILPMISIMESSWSPLASNQNATIPGLICVRDASTLQRGMWGNVSTYDMPLKGVALMLEGKLLPRTPAILASIISVTFIGHGKLPRHWMRTTCCVRRQVVFNALQWLKMNNTKYYGDIEISNSRIEELPEDDVPPEIIGIGARYVPNDDGEQDKTSPNDKEELNDTEGPDIIPLQVSGTIDTDMSRLAASEMITWGLANLWNEGKEGGYAVQHGQKPVSDFPPNPNEHGKQGEEHHNFFEKAFPCLFPYGEGGIEATQAVKVDFGEHVRWVLCYYDRHFRRHETFPFVPFGILQWRQSLGSAQLQMRRQTFKLDVKILSTITLDKLQKAQNKEEKNLPTLDPAIQLLKKHIQTRCY
ncbi:hypothetical protein DFJ58DRAFT_838742 [Suillus subalutaceus]|uniref:uncharacterized protein n=1 Tax=Suillus subalutaceus TaxID=48586 RepID=UPI001B874D27|nr:uncharacterized protein DFJ58DRAFT_838742 [Suillus subalutaceus]KAG1865004.1 hypothetical protein DFJ58DRAFT_838742 [Suillus subalutaceus]